ncbi:NRPS-like enzyme protein [Rutstroemia sp. NJR-2017a BBW]|nr:NRPS-like enzyme protein [Rutstroemia sp. NJR-2017a BBW]
MPLEHERTAQWRNSLLPHVVERLARETPDAKYSEWVAESHVVVITYAQLANIINGLAWLLVEQLNGPGNYGSHPEVLAYVGPNDVRYSALVLAAAKAGYTVRGSCFLSFFRRSRLFVTSPRNSPAAHRALFEQVKCRTLITSDPIPPAARVILDAVKPLRHFTMPSVEELLTKKYPLYELGKTFDELRQTPLVAMHTSGTTGLPKPLIWTHETCMQVLNANACETPDGIPSVQGSLLSGKRVIVTLPPFHQSHLKTEADDILLAQLLVGAIPYGNVVIAPVAAAIPTAQGVVNALKQSPADVAILVPSVVAELAHLLDYCAAHLQTIIYIGGDLPQDLGDRVAAKVYLRCLWGATETGIVPQLLPSKLLPSGASSRNLWRYIQFHPCVGAVFEKTTDEIYELVVRREKALANMQPCFTVPGMQQLEEYRTKDLFEPHPEIQDLWCWRARSDDIIVFLNGEKTNPISMEQHIMASNPEVSGALVIGAQRFQAALLIEPASENPLTTAEQAALIERIWPSIEESNHSAPAHARIEKSFVLVVPVDRRLIRAGKGTFMRGPSIAQYTEEIEKFSTGEVPLTLAPTGVDRVTRLIRQHIRAVTGWSTLDGDDNFFDRGMDSLQALQLMRALRRSFHRLDLALSTVYQNPTVSQLAGAILKPNENKQDERELMEALLATYQGLIKQIPVDKRSIEQPRQASEPINILLTGSTGTVGSQLLHALLDRPGIAHIFCLNRREDGGRARQYQNFTAAGLVTTKLDTRVTFLKADLESPSLGLDDPALGSLRTKVDLIIHAAWPVNFNLALSAFRPQLTSLLNLLTLAASATSPTVRFVFVSSVAAIEGHTASPAPEAILTDLNTPAPIGYACAKFLAELLIDTAGRHLGDIVTTTVIRVGQVAGPVQHPGLWNPHEWLPSLVLSSIHLGQVPDSLGSRFDDVDFVPVDLLGDILVDLAMSTTDSGEAQAGAATVYNLRNPHLVPWRTLLPAIVAIKPLQVVSPAIWLASLKASDDTDDGVVVARNPAVKLLDFFADLWATGVQNERGLVQPMVVGRALSTSTAMRNLEPVKVEWMRKWVEEWIGVR